MYFKSSLLPSISQTTTIKKKRSHSIEIRPDNIKKNVLYLSRTEKE